MDEEQESIDVFPRDMKHDINLLVSCYRAAASSYAEVGNNVKGCGCHDLNRNWFCKTVLQD